MAQTTRRAGIHDILASFERNRIRDAAEPRKSDSRLDFERYRRVRVPETDTAGIEAKRPARTGGRPKILHQSRRNTVAVGEQLLPSESLHSTRGGGDDLSNLNSARIQRTDVCRAIRVGGRGSRDEKHRWDIVVQEVTENE